MSSRMMNAFIWIIELVMQLMVALCLSNFIINGFMKYDEIHIFETVFIVIPVAGFFISRRVFQEKKKLMIITHLIALATPLYFAGKSEELSFIMIICGILFMVSSLQKKSQEPFVPLELGMIVAGYILSGTLKTANAAIIPAYCSVIYIILYFIHTNLINVRKFLIDNASIQSFKADQAMNVNIVMMAMFIVSCIAIMFVAPHLGLQKIIRKIGLVLGYGLVWLFRKIDMPTGGYEKELESKLTADIEEEESSGMLMLGTGEGSVILDTIAAVMAIALIVFLVVLAIRAIRQIRFEKVSGNDVKEFIKPQKYDISTEKKEHRKIFEIALDNNEKVRKKYKKYIKKNKGKSKIENSYTPTQITRLAGGEEDITKVYEKARYSNEIVSKEELYKL